MPCVVWCHVGRDAIKGVISCSVWCHVRCDVIQCGISTAVSKKKYFAYIFLSYLPRRWKKLCCIQPHSISYNETMILSFIAIETLNLPHTLLGYFVCLSTEKYLTFKLDTKIAIIQASYYRVVTLLQGWGSYYQGAKMHVGSSVQTDAPHSFTKLIVQLTLNTCWKLLFIVNVKVHLLLHLSSKKIIFVEEVVLKTSAFVITSVGSLKLLGLSNHEIRIRFLADFFGEEKPSCSGRKSLPSHPTFTTSLYWAIPASCGTDVLTTYFR